jgi:hypothetical protein
MKKIEEIAKITDFVPHGDESIIDDQGMTNRWAERNRERARLLQQQQEEHQRTLQEQQQAPHINQDRVWWVEGPHAPDQVGNEEHHWNTIENRWE